MFSGCEKKTEEVIEDNELVGGWKTVLKGNSANMISKAYETFLELNSKKYELVGLLGRRHTTNDEYMFLVKDTKNLF